MFELEAERIAKLNQHKTSQSSGSWYSKLVGISLGVAISLVVMLLVLVPSSAYAVFAYGFVLMKLWGWFVVPTFGVAPISWVVGGGIMLLVRLLTLPEPKNDKAEVKKPLSEHLMFLLGTMLIPWYSLLVGWLLYFFL